MDNQQSLDSSFADGDHLDTLHISPSDGDINPIDTQSLWAPKERDLEPINQHYQSMAPLCLL